MGDNIHTNLNLENNVSSSSINVNNNNNVNKTTLYKTSSNSLSVSNELKSLNKTPSFVSEVSTKSSKSTKSEKGKDKTKKKSKVKDILKKFEKRIIHNSNKKEKYDDASFSLSDTELDDSHNEVTENNIINNSENKQLEKSVFTIKEEIKNNDN